MENFSLQHCVPVFGRKQKRPKAKGDTKMFNNYKKQTKKLIKFTTKHLSKDVWSHTTNSDSYFDLYCTSWENFCLKRVYIKMNTISKTIALAITVDFVYVLQTYRATNKDIRKFKRLIRKLSANKL